MVAVNVRTYHPDVRVTLYKTVTRTTLDGSTSVNGRLGKQGQAIDLTRHLGETGGVQVSKSRSAPAGAFAITLADLPYAAAGGFDSFYGVIEPMDMIEIRMQHGPGGAAPPVIMRGFVGEVRRTETMGADGRPHRSVTITGQDYGKLWQMMRVVFFVNYITGQYMLDGFALFDKFGVGAITAETGSAFVLEVLSKIINPYLANIVQGTSAMPSTISMDGSALPAGMTSLTGPQNQEGSIYDILRNYLDVGAWNELFIEDRADGPWLVYRPLPFFDVNGNLIQAGAPLLTPVQVPIEDVVSMVVSRSDADVANYFWVNAPRFDINSGFWEKAWAIPTQGQTMSTATYQNSNVALYGIRLMQLDSQMGWSDVTNFSSGLPSAEKSIRDTSMANWINQRRQVLIDNNKDNVLFERGSIRLRGNETIRAGAYIQIVRGDMAPIYYVDDVTHDYVPFQGFWTTVNVQRGTGFIERVKRAGGAASPYTSELEAATNG